MVSTKYHQPSRVNSEVVIDVANIKCDLRKLLVASLLAEARL